MKDPITKPTAQEISYRLRFLKTIAMTTLNLSQKIFHLCLCHFSLPMEAVAFFNRGNGLYTVQYLEKGDYLETPESYTWKELCNNYDISKEEFLRSVY